MAEVCAISASVITVVHMFIKVGVLCSTYYANVKTARSEIRSILSEADRFSAALGDVERLLAGPNGRKVKSSQSIICSIADCQRELNNLATKLEHGTKLRSVLWPLTKAEVADIVRRLVGYRDNISLALHLDQMALLHDVHQEIILAKLRSVQGAAFDSRDEANNARCHRHTRMDILQGISEWGFSHHGECIFWLNGMAGTGKSTISRTVADSFAGIGILGASFFFKRGEGDRGRTKFFFASIITQLVQHLPVLVPHVHDAVESDPSINEKSLRVQFEKLIANPIRKLPCHKQAPVVVVVVDALDECDELENIRLVIQVLSQAKLFTSIRMKFFLTSRPELPIRLGFEDICGKYEDMILHQIPKIVIEHDINEYFQYELSKIREDYNKSVTTTRQLPLDWPGEEDTKKLVALAIPLFIFAATVCRFIQDRRFGGPEKQLARVLNQQKNHKSNLDATYLPVLDQLLLNLGESEKREVAGRFKRIIGPIVVLASPLSKISLVCLLGIPLSEMDNQLDFLHSVLSIPSDQHSPVRLLHLSFRDFLVDPEKGAEKEKYPFWVNERQTHERLAVQCLKLLSTGHTLKKDICSLGHPGIRRTDIDRHIIDAALTPEAQYACRFWTYHWTQSKCLIRDGSVVDRFMTQHFLHWFESLSLLGRVSESVGMVNNLLGLLDPYQSARISAFLLDCRRGALHNWPICHEWPLQAYCAALVFAPNGSIVRQALQNQYPTWLTLPPCLDIDWDACSQMFEGHYSWVGSVSFSSDTTLMASANDYSINVWDVKSGHCLQMLNGHLHYIKSIAFAKGSAALLASASVDKMVKVWDMNSGRCIQTLTGHDTHVISVAFLTETTLASASSDHEIKLWNADSGECLWTVKCNDQTHYLVAFSTVSTLASVSYHSRIIRIWDTNSGQCLQELLGHRDSVSAVAFSEDSTRLASASSDNTVKIWDVNSGECLQTLTRILPDKFISVAFSTDLALVAVSKNNTIKIWDTNIGECLQEIVGHRFSVRSLAFSNDSTRLVSASRDTIKVWDVNPKCSQWAQSRRSAVSRVFPSKDFTRVASLSAHNTLKIWDTSTGACIWRLEGHRRSQTKWVAFSANSARLASVSSSSDQGDCPHNEVKIWDTNTGECLQSLDTTIATTNDILSNSNRNLSHFAESGIIDLDYLSEPHQDPIDLELDVLGLTIDEENTWIMYGSEKLIWIPPEYRPTSKSLSRNTVSVGTALGRVWTCKIDLQLIGNI